MGQKPPVGEPAVFLEQNPSNMSRPKKTFRKSALQRSALRLVARMQQAPQRRVLRGWIPSFWCGFSLLEAFHFWAWNSAERSSKVEECGQLIFDIWKKLKLWVCCLLLSGYFGCIAEKMVCWTTPAPEILETLWFIHSFWCCLPFGDANKTIVVLFFFFFWSRIKQQKSVSIGLTTLPHWRMFGEPSCDCSRN